MTFRAEPRANRAGRLAEDYARRVFGIREDANHEIKGMSIQPGNGLVRLFQLTRSIEKVYWFVCYDRDYQDHVLKTGLNKGRRRRRPRLTIEEAFEQNRVKIAALQGTHLLDAIVRVRQHLQRRNDSITKGTTLFYWRLRWNELLHDCAPYEHCGVEIRKHYDLHPELLLPTPIQLAFPVTEPPELESQSGETQLTFPTDIPF